MRIWLAVVSVALGVLLGGVSAQAQALPPDDSPELFRNVQLRFPTSQVGVGRATPESYLELLEVAPLISSPREERWMPYADAETAIAEAAERLWNTGWLESLWVEVRDDPYDNGVMGKRVIFNVVEHPQPGDQPTVPEGFESPPDDHERLFPTEPAFAIYRPGQDRVEPPRLLEEVQPKYTPEARVAGIEGVVRLDVIVNEDGRVAYVDIERSLDDEYGLDDEAVAAARQWRFSPGTRSGEPVLVRLSIELVFDLSQQQ